MLQTLRHIQKTDADIIAIRAHQAVDRIDPNRHFNSPPPNLTEISEAEVVTRTLMGSFYADAQEMRQFPIDGRFATVYLSYFFDGTGVAQHFDHEQKRVRWFKFGCVDPKHSINHCSQCGHSAHFDSSG